MIPGFKSKVLYDLSKEHSTILETLMENIDESESFSDPKNEKNQPWKIIIFDKFTQQSLSTLFKVGDLRKKNITLHLLIDQVNEEVTGVDTLCFLVPSQENLEKIGGLVKRGFIDNVYLNFLGCLVDIESDIRKLAGYCGSQAGRIRKIVQHNLGFISLGTDCFTLATDLDLINFMGLNPVIVAQEDDRVSSFCSKLKALSAISEDDEGSEDNRPTKIDSAVIIYTRDFDMAVSLHHSWLYQPLIAEEYKLRYNKAVKGEELHDLDVRKDEFWQRNINKEFPAVAEDNGKTVIQWKKEYDAISTRQMTDDMKEFTDSICSALDLVPEMNERRKRNESHTQILEALLKSIKSRRLDEFNNCEVDLLRGETLSGEDLSMFESLLSADSSGNEKLTLDKIRLFIIYLFSKDNLKAKDADGYFQAIKSTSKLSEAQLSVLRNMIKARTSKSGSGSGSGLLNSFASRSFSLMKNLIRGDKGSKIEGIVNEVSKPNLTLEGFSSSRLFKGEEMLVSNLSFKKIIVFSLDHGSYVEYNSINKLDDTLKQNIIYGAGKFSTPSEILTNLFNS